MLDSNNNVKLIDFTLAKSRILEENDDNEEVTRALDGFRFYKSPERLKVRIYKHIKSNKEISELFFYIINI